MRWIRNLFVVLGLSVVLIFGANSCRSRKEYSQIHEKIDYNGNSKDSLSLSQKEWLRESDSLKISYISVEFENGQELGSNSKPKKITTVEIISLRHAEAGKVEQQTQATEYSVQSKVQLDKEREISIRPSKYSLVGFVITLIIVIVFIKIRIK